MFTIETKARITALHLKIFIIGLSIVLIFSFCGIASAAIWFVSADIGISGNGTTWQNAFLTIHEAANASNEGDEVWVKKGTYSLSSQINIDQAVGVYGGFVGDEIQRNQRDWATNVTTVDGQDSVYHCFYITADATLDGLIITGGSANGSSSPNDSGGGIYVYQSSPSITNCTFTENSTITSGGGIYNYQSSPTITDCTLLGNSAGWGGGIYNGKNSSPTITNCIFTENIADVGAGIQNSSSSPSITNCTFTENSGGLGGGIENSYSSPNITNCILWGNTAYFLYPEISDMASSPIVTYSNIQGGYQGEGNISADPLFVDPSNDDYHIQETSPCIDKGSNSAAGLPDTDFEGDQRIFDGDVDGTATVDIGIDEYVDNDRDGLPDYWEMAYFDNLNQASYDDYDGDGKSN